MPEGVGGAHDPVARRAVEEVRHELRNFQAVTDIKAENLKQEVARQDVVLKADLLAKHTDLKDSLTKIESLMKWAGSLIVTLILGVLGWSLVQQVQSNEQQKKDLQSQIKLLEQQDRTRMLEQQRMLPPSAAETALSAQRTR